MSQANIKEEQKKVMSEKMYAKISERTWSIFQQILDEPSLHPDLERKTREERLNDLIIWLNKYKYINSDYNECGMDVKGFTEQDEYVDHFRAHLDALKKFNYYWIQGSPVPRPINATLSDNKYVFSTYLNGIYPGITPKIFLYILRSGSINLQNNIYTTASNAFDAIAKLPNGKYVCKPVMGQCGRNINIIEVNNNEVILGNRITYGELYSCFRKEDYIVQEYIYQCDEMKKLNPSSVNTVRITTTKFNNYAHVFTGMLRIGVSNTYVDNAAAGGTCVGVNVETGKLMKWGCYHNKPKEIKHPISKIIYENYQIPFWKESVNLVKQLHLFFKGFPSIGWDIAITEKGPIIIENNYDWAFGIMQQIHGGLKERWEKAKELP